MKSSVETLQTFPLLANPGGYLACELDLAADGDQRTYWIDLFRRHLQSMVEQIKSQGADDPQVDERAAIVSEEFGQYLATISAEPDRLGRLDILAICWARERALGKAGIEDAYHGVKQRENRVALAVLVDLLEQLDAMDDEQRARHLIEGIFAGNIFDLGAPKTVALFNDNIFDFHATRRQLKPRPWLVDDLDAWLKRWRRRPHKSAVLFVDNAGCDIVLGMIPFARELLRRGTSVLLTANTTPSLNDVTHDELTELIQGVAGDDDVIAAALSDGRLELVASGNGVPLIDLAGVSPLLADAVVRRAVDLVVIEGMGRAVESNFDAAFACDTVKVAMIKDPGVAAWLGGETYDLVFKYEPV